MGLHVQMCVAVTKNNGICQRTRHTFWQLVVTALTCKRELMTALHCFRPSAFELAA